MQTFSQDTLFAREAQLIEAARAGEVSSLIEYLYEFRLMARAARLVNGFRDAYGVRLDAEDVAMEGAEEVVRKVHKALAEAVNPVGWLMHTAQLHMLQYCLENRSPIRVPFGQQSKGKKPPQVASLDAPLASGEDMTLLDLIPASG